MEGGPGDAVMKRQRLIRPELGVASGRTAIILATLTWLPLRTHVARRRGRGGTAMQDELKTTSGASAATGAGKKSLEERALDELKRYAVITLYLWVLFVLFATYKRMLLQENGISLWNQSFAIVNALIFGKVILIAQALDLGKSLKEQALIWVVVGKSLLFAVVMILFHIAEEAIRAWFNDLPLATAVRDFGGGTWLGLLTYAAIFFVVLIPFFAFQEVADVVGRDALRDLFITRDGRSLKLFRE
jgi:hypothetical protein